MHGFQSTGTPPILHACLRYNIFANGRQQVIKSKLNLLVLKPDHLEKR